MWRSVHKMMHNTLNIKTAVAYIPYQDLENKDMMVAFLDEPNDFFKHVRRYTTSLTTQMVYGYRTTSKNDVRLLQFFEVSPPVICVLVRKLISSRTLNPGVSLSALAAPRFWIYTLFFTGYLDFLSPHTGMLRNLQKKKQTCI